MWLRFFCFVFSASLYGQDCSSAYSVLESSADNNFIYQFNAEGKLLQFSRFKNDDEETIFKIDYQDSLLANITIFKRFSTRYLKKYDFVYDKNRNLIAQKSSEENDSIKFFYDSKGRINEIKNYYDNNVEYKYLKSGNICEQISRSTNEELSAYYDLTNYTYETDKIIEETTSYSPYGQSKFIKIKEFNGQNFIKETSSSPTNPYVSPVIIEYNYTEEGFLKSEISKLGTKNYDIIRQPDKIKSNVIKKINSVLIGDFKSMGWY